MKKLNNIDKEEEKYIKVLKSKKIDLHSSMQNNSEWDSLNHLNILEKIFCVHN